VAAVAMVHAQAQVPRSRVPAGGSAGKACRGWRWCFYGNGRAPAAVLTTGPNQRQAAGPRAILNPLASPISWRRGLADAAPRALTLRAYRGPRSRRRWLIFRLSGAGGGGALWGPALAYPPMFPARWKWALIVLASGQLGPDRGRAGLVPTFGRSHPPPPCRPCACASWPTRPFPHAVLDRSDRCFGPQKATILQEKYPSVNGRARSIHFLPEP